MATLWGVFSCRLLAVDWQPVVRHCVTSHVVMSCVWLSRVDQVCMCPCVHVQPVCCVVLVAAAFTSRLEADVVHVLEWWWRHKSVWRHYDVIMPSRVLLCLCWLCCVAAAVPLCLSITLSDADPVHCEQRRASHLLSALYWSQFNLSRMENE